MPPSALRAQLMRLADMLPRGSSLPDQAWIGRHTWMVRVLWVHVAGLTI